jgi:cyanophycinase-like exopeptidase
VRDVLKAHFDKKERLTLLQQNQARTVAALGLGVPDATGEAGTAR